MVRRQLTKRLRDPGSNRVFCAPPSPPRCVLGGGDDIAFVVVVGVVRALIVVVVARAALIFRISTTLVVRVLGLGSMHMAGLVLGGLFVRRLVFAVALGVWLAFAVG